MNDSLFDIAGKVTLVSGGSRGIGRALAQGFAARGAKTIITGRDETALSQASAEISTQSNIVETFVCDVSRLEDIEQCVQHVINNHQRIDVLLNVAGVNIRQPTLAFNEADYDYVADINQKGAFFVAKAVGNTMVEHGSGCIINIDSLSTYAPARNLLPYAMTKSALVALTRGLALEWGEHGVRVNTISPGFIVTDLTRKLWSDPTMESWHNNNTPLGRLGNPEDLIGAAVFLASDASAFMSGQVVRVDGGFSAGLNWPIPDDGGQ